MASLKKELEAVALRLGSAGSRVAASGISIAAPSTGSSVTYVAPNDGIIFFGGRTISTAWGGYHIERVNNTSFSEGQDADGYLWSRLTISVKKGEKCVIYAKGNFEPITPFFIPTVGSTS